MRKMSPSCHPLSPCFSSPSMIENNMKALLFFLPFLCMGACSPKPAGSPADELFLLVGTYTNGASKGIYTFHFNQQTGESEPLDSVALPNPSFLTVSEDHRHVYAVSEMSDSTAAINTLSFNPQDGALRWLGRQWTLGADPCHVAANKDMVLTANYGGGSLSVFPLREDGMAAPVDTLFQGQATGPDSLRQAVPHVHCAAFSPDGKYVFATDFSADRILQFAVTADGLVALSGAAPVSLRPGTGPRHLTFAPDGKHAYVIGELSGEITVFAYAAGQLTALQTVSADTTGAQGSADIHVSPDGKFLYASNRLKEDGIAIFAVHPQDGTLALKGYQLTGLHPRHFNLTPNGKYLLVACRDSHVIQVFERNPQTGMLKDTGKGIPLDKPVCIVFVGKS